MSTTVSHRSRLFGITSLVLALSLVLAPVAEAATYYSTAKWVRTNLFVNHSSYGVFVIPAGHSNLRLYYMTGSNTGYYLGNSQCRIPAVNGPGYINDVSGMYSAYVPAGWIGMAICGSTSTLWTIMGRGYNINDRTRWRVYFDK